MTHTPAGPRGRGAQSNPKHRFERLEVLSEELPPESVDTEILADGSKSIITRNDSPDVSFAASLNPYRGCEHGCAYCYARPSHEFLGFSAGLDFETKILAKREAPALLERELSSPRWRPQTLALSGVTDPYQPLEKRLELTRGCLEVLARFRNPVEVITKNVLIARDIDLLSELARHRAAGVMISITTLSGEVAAKMEPRAAHPRERLKTVEKLASAGIPTGVLIAPVVPALTDHELTAIVRAAADAGAVTAGYVLLRLPGTTRDVFFEWLQNAFPQRASRVESRIRSLRNGRLNDTKFGRRGRGTGAFAEQLRGLFDLGLTQSGLKPQGFELSTSAFRRPGDQLGLFG
ncbi:MAG: PA0069 family radical SAM protein [Acidobacteriota bacterium]